MALIVAGKTYEVLRTLARGGMGEVILARERAGDIYERHVVLKTVLPHLADDEQFVQAFLDEARIACQLQHPNIALIFDIASLEGAPCIVMEWLRGRNLGRILKALTAAGRQMPVEVAASIVLGAASALDHAHRATDFDGNPLGVVHRDVSPQNIVVTYAGVVKLIDFGIALSLHRSSKTAAGVLKGKFGYMAPEQLRGRGADARSDLWALGVVAWECLAGRRLFGSRRGTDVAATVLEGEIPPPSLARPELDSELDAIVLGLLERDPAARIQSAAELEQRLTNWSRGNAIPTQPELAAWLTALLPEDEDGTDPGLASAAGPTSSITLESLDAADGTPPIATTGPASPAPGAPVSEASTELLSREQQTRELRTRIAPTRVVPGRRRRPAWLVPAAVAGVLLAGAAGVLAVWLLRPGDSGSEATAPPPAEPVPAEPVEPASPAPESPEESIGAEAAPAEVEPPEPARTVAEPPAEPRPERRTAPRPRRPTPRMQQPRADEGTAGGLVDGIESVYDLDR